MGNGISLHVYFALRKFDGMHWGWKLVTEIRSTYSRQGLFQSSVTEVTWQPSY